MHHIGLHHALQRKHALRQSKFKPWEKYFDKAIYFIIILGVTVNIPQLYNVWTSPDVSGVSVWSWIGFLIGSVFWLCYGLLHREKPIIFANVLLILMQSLIVLGILAHG